MSKFQLISLFVFGFFIVVGVAIFALGGLSEEANVSSATVWGTMDSKVFEGALASTGLYQNKAVSITYVQKNPLSFDQELLEALALGVGPDIFFITNESVLKHRAKILTIPYENYPARDFLDSFIEAGEVFLTPDGVLALPFSVDPMVMYWNRDLFANAGLASPPRSWTGFYDLSTLITKKDSNLNVTVSSAPLGEFANVSHAFDIISLLFMQAGSPIVRTGSTDGLLRSAINEPPLAAERGLSFFTEFANPLKSYYSWNRSLPLSKNFFLSGGLATYFGFASELAELRLKNPNLNFDVAAIPQAQDAARVTTIADITGLAISKNSLNVAGAYNIATLLTSRDMIDAFSKATNLPPVRRDSLAVKPNQPYLSVFYDAAVQSKSWIVPDAVKTPAVFKEMVESVTGGRDTVSEAVARANDLVGLQISQ